MSQSSSNKDANGQSSSGQAPSNKITIYVDDVAYQVDKSNNLLAGVLSQKLKLPYFCWHPAMGSVGACRQCAVTQYQDENDTRGRMVMSCMTPVSDGMRIGLTDKSSSKFREQVISAMMTNHPHDCPVCAEGGECHLQDMTVMTGHSERQYQGKKRTFTNQYLGELVGHEMNRCITCYRCVRFYNDYAGGEDFGAYGSKNQVYFGRQTDGMLESEFAGNLVEVCPTGVFTNKVFSAHYTRKWDLQSAPSVCSHCSVGCNTSIGERYGSVRRVMNRYNSEVNGYFLCDRGRYGIGFVNSSKRLTQAKGLNDDTEDICELSVAKKLAHHRPERFIGIGSARASFEANRLLKNLVGRENFSLGYTNNEMQLAVLHKQLLAQYPQKSIAELEQQQTDKNDLLLIIGEDLHQTAPRLALAVKQALRSDGIEKAATIGIKPWQDSAVRTYAGKIQTPLFSLQAKTTQFDQSAKQALVLAPAEIVNSIECLTTMLNSLVAMNVVSLNNNLVDAKNDVSEQSPVFNDEINNMLAEFHDDTQSIIKQLFSSLQTAKKPLVITGTSLQRPELLNAIERLMASLSSDKFIAAPELITVAPQCNSVGSLALLNEQSLSLEQIQDKLLCQQSDSLIVLEHDLAQLTEPQLLQLRQHCKTLIVLDHSESQLTTLADIVMPVAAVSESEGHFLNYQGILQEFVPALVAKLPIMSNWRWLSLLAKNLFKQAPQYFKSLAQLHHYFSELGEPWAVQITQADAQNTNRSYQNSNKGIAKQTHRSSGRTAMVANQTMHEPKTCRSEPSLNKNSQNKSNESESEHHHYNASMEGLTANSDTNMPFTWSPSWNSNQAILQHQQQVNGDLIGQVKPNWLMFSFDEKLTTLWQTENEQESKQEKPRLTFIQNLPWFLQEQQARTIPEFVLMYGGNIIEISNDLATKLGWDGSQNEVTAKLTFSADESLSHTNPINTESLTSTETFCVFARVKVNPKLASNVVVGSIFEFNPSQTNCNVNLALADEDEVEQFKQQQTNRQNSAIEEQQNTLARLKKQDQHIPIHLMSGGLNDG